MFLRQMKTLVSRRPTSSSWSAVINVAGRQHLPSQTTNIRSHREASGSSSSKSPPPPIPPLNAASPDDTRHTAAETAAIDITNTATNIVADGSTHSLLQKWRQRFDAESVPEIESSLRNILAHVLRVKRLPDIEPLLLLQDADTGAADAQAQAAAEQAKVAAALPQLSAEQLARFEELCECRVLRMPIQYIIGEWDFRDLTLQMRPPVFIPRPETEELVELVLQQFDVKRPLQFLEIGCGSGAISLALLKALPKAVGVAVDQSEMACELTLSNAQRHQLDGRLQVRREKLTRAALEERPEVWGEQVDLIVSNPPYVPNKLLRGLEPEVKIYEDLRALDGGATGMDTIESILWLASKRLRPATGVLWLEVDPTHPALIQKYLGEHSEALQLKWVASYQDIFRKDRFVEIVRV